ncbi:MAG TPA: adenylyltransferase/cytidyltransferase family protein, partial [Bacteroidales bacterium]|nr:adenylyltransferase/cytidyltransferase family protein [Bacteroidales bacterium]
MRTVLFPGTFDPFTLGHESIVKRSMHFFDRLIIAIGINDQKKPY